MSNTKHTPVPYFLRAEYPTDIIMGRQDNENWDIAEICTELPKEIQKANAEFIVKCCNNHDKLVDYLTELLKMNNDKSHGDLVWRLAVCEKAEQLLESLKD